VEIILKFTNGNQILIPVADDTAGYWDVIAHLRAIKENGSPIEVVLDTGETYVNSGKELISIEIRFQ
jgi:hypothetical protein